MNLQKIFIFGVVNSLMLFVLWACFYHYFPIIFYEQPIATLFFSVIIVFSTALMDINYYRSVFGNPGYLEAERHSIGINEEDQDQIKRDSAKFKARLNSARKFISLGGHAIKKEDLDMELAIKFSKMQLSEIKKEMQEIYIEFIDKPIECGRCRWVKPPRTHHCTVCQGCVRRMDHHCPWIANCVGEDNLKDFLRFTGFATLSLTMVSFFILFNYIFSSAVT